MNKNKKKIQKSDNYSGQWVAFLGPKIIAHHKTLKELMKEIEEMDLRKKVSVFLVPRKDEGPYCYLYYEARVPIL